MRSVSFGVPIDQQPDLGWCACNLWLSSYCSVPAPSVFKVLWECLQRRPFLFVSMSPVSSPVDSFIFAANATSTTTTSHVVASKFDTIAFVFHIDIFIFAFFGLFACLTLPRLFTRLSRGSEWAHGYFFYTATPEKARKVWKSKYVISPPLESVSHRAAFSGSDESHTFNSHTHLVRRNDEKGRKLHLPPHTQSWAGRYHKISAFLGRTCFPGYSIGRSMVVLGYFLIILYATVYKSSPFSDPQRAGFVAMSQLPIVFALATKNNILGMLLALGYEKVRYVLIEIQLDLTCYVPKLNWLHRAAGRILALAANMHALGYSASLSICCRLLFTEHFSLQVVHCGRLPEEHLHTIQHQWIRDPSWCRPDRYLFHIVLA